MDIAKIIILFLYLLFVSLIIFFNWLYSVRTIRATKQIGLYVPEYIKLLIKISNIFAIATAILIGFFLLAKMY